MCYFMYSDNANPSPRHRLARLTRLHHLRYAFNISFNATYIYVQQTDTTDEIESDTGEEEVEEGEEEEDSVQVRTSISFIWKIFN